MDWTRPLKILCLVPIVFLLGCAAEIMQGYVGKSITEPMLDYGRPSNVFDLPNGQRAFQWKVNTSGVVPMTTPTTSNFYGSGGWFSVTSTTTSYAPYSSSCLYTLLSQPKGDDWIVVGFREPTLMCQ